MDQDSISSWKNNETREDAHFEYGIGKEFLDAHGWYVDVERLKELLDKAPDIAFVCGVTENQDDYFNLFDKVFLLQCPKDTFTKRIDNRGKKFGKHPSEKEHLLGWHEGFEQNLIDKGVTVINSEKPIDVVVDEILNHIK